MRPINLRLGNKSIGKTLIDALAPLLGRYHEARKSLRGSISRQSQRGLDWMNFFLADVQTAFGALGGGDRACSGPRSVGKESFWPRSWQGRLPYSHAMGLHNSCRFFLGRAVAASRPQAAPGQRPCTAQR